MILNLDKLLEEADLEKKLTAIHNGKRLKAHVVECTLSQDVIDLGPEFGYFMKAPDPGYYRVTLNIIVKRGK